VAGPASQGGLPDRCLALTPTTMVHQHRGCVREDAGAGGSSGRCLSVSGQALHDDDEDGGM